MVHFRPASMDHLGFSLVTFFDSRENSGSFFFVQIAVKFEGEIEGRSKAEKKTFLLSVEWKLAPGQKKGEMPASLNTMLKSGQK